MLLDRIKYISSIFFIEEDFFDAQFLFCSMLFYRHGPRPRVYCYYTPSAKFCSPVFNRYQMRWKICTPYKDLTKKGLRDFLIAVMVIYRLNEDCSEFIDEIIKDVMFKVTAYSKGNLTGLMGVTEESMPSNRSISSEVQPIAPSTASVDKKVI